MHSLLVSPLIKRKRSLLIFSLCKLHIMHFAHRQGRGGLYFAELNPGVTSWWAQSLWRPGGLLCSHPLARHPGCPGSPLRSPRNYCAPATLWDHRPVQNNAQCANIITPASEVVFDVGWSQGDTSNAMPTRKLTLTRQHLNTSCPAITSNAQQTNKFKEGFKNWYNLGLSPNPVTPLPPSVHLGLQMSLCSTKIHNFI